MCEERVQEIMTKGRIRIEGPTLQNWDQVNERLAESGLIDLELQEIEAVMNLAISSAKETASLNSKDLKSRQQVIAMEVKEYVDYNRDDIKGKEKLLAHGKVGYRLSTKISVPIRKVAEILKNLKLKNMLDCIRVKEDVDKEALRKYTAEEIAEIGCMKKVEDVFFMEPDYETLKD